MELITYYVLNEYAVLSSFGPYNTVVLNFETFIIKRIHDQVSSVKPKINSKEKALSKTLFQLLDKVMAYLLYCN